MKKKSYIQSYFDLMNKCTPTTKILKIQRRRLSMFFITTTFFSDVV